jgi:hypothetical protein
MNARVQGFRNQKILCACGCGEFLQTPGTRYVRRGHRARGSERSTTTKSSMSPTLADLHWIAGFLEGEGAFVLTRTTVVVSAGQVQQEPLDRLRKFLGGSIVFHTGHEIPMPYWTVCGSRARGMMMTIFSLMSPRRQAQIKTCLGDNKWH